MSNHQPGTTGQAKTVGIIGVGLMGLGIATNLQKKGWRVDFLDHPENQPTTDLLANGARAYPTGQELAANRGVIIVCVTGSPQVEDVLLRDDGVLAGLRPGTTIIDCSTAIPESTRRLAAATIHLGGHFLDAPMTRTPKEAAEGRLNLVVGGNRQCFDLHTDLFSAFAEHVTYVGPVGSGHTLKLLHNFVSLGFSVVLAEVAAAATAAGIASDVLVDVLAKGGGAGVVLDRLSPFILRRDDSNFRFSLSNAAKDTAYCLAMFEELGAEKQVLGAVTSLLSGAARAGENQASVPQLIDFLMDVSRAQKNS